MEDMEATAPEGARLNRWQKFALGGAGCALAGVLGGVAAAPWAASESITNSVVHDDAGPIPADIRFSPGYSQLDLGIVGGKIYNSNLESHKLGLNIKPAGPPDVISKLLDGNSPNISRTVKQYASFYGNPSSVADGYKQALMFEAKDQFLKRELEAGIPLAVLIGLIGGLALREFDPKKAKKAALLGVGTVMVLSAGAAYSNYHDWQSSNQISGKTYEVKSLDDTTLAGSQTSNPALAKVIDTKLKPQLDKLLGREEQANQEFIEKAYQTIDQQIESGAISPPDGDETMVLALSDMHANQDMIKVYTYLVKQINERYGDGTVSMVVMCGDQTYGSAGAKSAVDAMAKIGDGAPAYYIAGNHDSKITIQQLNSAGLKRADGSVIQTPAGLPILGGDDPELTQLGALFGFGDNVSRTGSDLTEAEAGQKLVATVNKEGKVAIVMAHEGYEMADINGFKVSGPTDYDKWFDKSGDDSGADPDDVPDQPASLELFGHWHHGNTKQQKRYRVVSNSDGSWTVVSELGTAGGAIGSMSLTNFSTPWTVPGKTAAAELITFNNDSKLVTKMQDLKTSTEGDFSAWQPNAIGSADGQPYQLGSIVEVKHQPEKHQQQNLTEAGSQSKTDR